MKRGAEFQLTKNDSDARENEESEDSNPGQGFQKASENILATRKIKPLPSRAGAGTPKPALGGLAPSNLANPFLAGGTSLPSPSISTTTPTSFLPSSTGFFSKAFDKSHDTTGVTPPFSTPSSSPFSVPPAMSTGSGAATNTSKAFASILNTSSTNIFTNPFSHSPPAITTQSTSKHSNGIAQSSLTKYYINLRGLNVSLSNFIKNSTETDPFSDLTSALESYKTHRSQIQKDYNDASEKEKSKPSTSGPSAIFGGFGEKSTTTSTSSGSIFGSGSGNPFGTLKPAPSESSSPTTMTPASTNIFGLPPATSLFGNLSKPPTTFTTTAFSTTAPSSDTAFGTPKSSASDNTSTPTEKPSVFSSSTSTSAFQPTKPPFSFVPSSSLATSNPFAFPAANLFGSSASIPAFGVSANSSTSDKKPGPSIPFGSPSQVAKNTGVFYGFGNGPHSTSTSTNPTPESESQETSTEDGVAGTGSEGTDPKEPLPGLLTPNPHDEEGAGEENEETVHAVKLKAYRMRKAGEQGGSGWAELGMGILRLKKDKDTDARRMLLRNSTNGKININFKIYAGLKPSISKKALTFVGHADGVSQTYCVRLPSEEQANELKEMLDREIEFIKAKEG